MSDIGQTDTDDLESVLRLLTEIRSLIREEERLTADARLRAIDTALIVAIAGTPEKARDFVRNVILGRVKP